MSHHLKGRGKKGPQINSVAVSVAELESVRQEMILASGAIIEQAARLDKLNFVYPWQTASIPVAEYRRLAKERSAADSPPSS